MHIVIHVIMLTAAQPIHVKSSQGRAEHRPNYGELPLAQRIIQLC